MICVLVEGADDQLAVPKLTGREQIQVRCIPMNGKSNMVRQNRGFEDTVRRQHCVGGHAFIILMDGDVTYPPYASLGQERADMVRRAEALAAELEAFVQICWSVLELESWLIAGLQVSASYCGLSNVGRVPANTESTPKDPKRWLADHLQGDYQPRTAECLARSIELEQAKLRNQSLQVFLAAVRQATGSEKTQ
jgi:hypothetical protein